MTSRELVLDTMRRSGRLIAADLQSRAADLTGTALNSEADYLPTFAGALAKCNMLARSAGFVCRSPAGRVVRLLQPYDSDIYPQEPEELGAQWGFVWSDDPNHARPFAVLSTSPYMTGNCCTDDGKTWRSTMDNNTWRPSEYPAGWEVVNDAD